VPETLIDGLDFPGRMATDGANIYVANRRHFQVEPTLDGDPDAPLDQLLVFPVSEGVSEPTVLFEHPDISGVAVHEDQIYIASIRSNEFAVYDKTTGMEISAAMSSGTGTPYQVAVSGEQYYFATTSPQGAGFWVGAPGAVAQRVLTEVIGSPMWLLASGTNLYAMIGGEGGSNIWAFDSTSSEQRVLAQTEGWAGALALSGNTLLFTDWAGNRLERVTLDTQVVTTVAQVPQAWGVLVDGEYAYVTTQPDFCRTMPEGTLQRVSLADGSTTQLTAAVSCPSMMLTAGDWLYWLNNGQADDSSEIGIRSLGTGSLARLRRSR